MRRILLGILAAAALLGTNHSVAQEKGVTFSGGSDLVSSYYWRGVRESGPALQPTLAMTVGNFSVTAWGSIDFSDSGYKEMDLTLAYQAGPVTISLADLYWTGHDNDRYFVFDNHSPHRIEVGASWVVSQKVPITLSVHDSLRCRR